uniref:Protein yippee-like n=1 Tax=Moniliophthora roreri TaxID=221103 RepID=A0A0W0EWX0_MONRR
MGVVCTSRWSRLISRNNANDDSLMQSATNVKLGSKEERPLLTGVHTVADVFCLGCNERLGWYYHKASEYAQKYKEGKYLLEREKLIKENAWQLEE